MKFSVTFKDPDVVHDACVDAAKELLQAVQGIDDEERESLIDARRDKLQEFTSQWVKYGEYIDIEFDTEANTAVVVQRKALTRKWT